MKKGFLIGLAFVFVFSGISLAKSPEFQEGSPGRGKGSMGVPIGKWWKLPQVADRLQLTQADKDKLDRIYLEHRRRMIDLRGQLAKERLELEQLFDSAVFDSAACMARFKRLQEAQGNLATERFKFLVQVRESLGLDRFQELKAEVRRHRMKRR